MLDLITEIIGMPVFGRESKNIEYFLLFFKFNYADRDTNALLDKATEKVFRITIPSPLSVLFPIAGPTTTFDLQMFKVK